MKKRSFINYAVNAVNVNFYLLKNAQIFTIFGLCISLIYTRRASKRAYFMEFWAVFTQKLTQNAYSCHLVYFL